MGYKIHSGHDKSKGASDRSFGAVFALLFLVIAVMPISGDIKQLLVDHDLSKVHGFAAKVNWWSLLASGVLLLAAALVPRILSPLNRLWMAFGSVLHKVISPIVLGIIFFGALTPIALLMRLLRRDFLGLQFDRNAKTYWVERRPPGPDPKTLSRQF